MANLSRKGAKLSDTAQMSGSVPELAVKGLNCQDCVKYEFCREICPEVEALLPKKTTGKHKKEITVSTEYAESLGVQRAFKLKYGKKYDIFKHESDF